VVYIFSTCHTSFPYYNEIDRKGGGVAIYVRDSLRAMERKDLQVQCVQVFLTEIEICQHKLIVGGIYRPPNNG
jgi:hypothetical protein